jgi:two-component system chemotaxis response regulator CheY
MSEREKKRILLVDDSRTVRQLLSLVLKKYLFCDVTEACDGREAVQNLDSDSFDLLITDINMPNMNGLSLVRKVRGDMNLSIPIIIVTTMGKEQDRDAGLELGANSYVTKPINGSVLIREATQLLS